VTPDMPLETMISVFTISPIAVVVPSGTEDRRAIGILTKIDVLSHLTQQKGS